MDLKTFKASIEAVLFAYAEPLSVVKLSEMMQAKPSLIEKILLSLRDEYENENRGIQLIQLEGAWQFTTKNIYGEVVKKALDTRKNAPLSSAALEVLAIIAYNQPVTRSFIEQVRGVDSSRTVTTLAEKGLVAEAGRLDLPGKPIAFCTTDVFLRCFGISSLHELPALREQEQENEADLYHASVQEDYQADDISETKATRGGNFIEAEGGMAAMIGEDE